MIGAIIGDIIGSQFVKKPTREREFALFGEHCRAGASSIMTLAVAQALLETSTKNFRRLSPKATEWMRRLARDYPHRGYSDQLGKWLYEVMPQPPINDLTADGAARVTPCGWAGVDVLQARSFATKVTKITQERLRTLRAAEMVAAAVHLAHTGKTREEISVYLYNNLRLRRQNPDYWRREGALDDRCTTQVPAALEAVFTAESFEEAIRTAVSYGAHADVIGSIAGGVAEAVFGVPAALEAQALTYLDNQLVAILTSFQETFVRPAASETAEQND